MRRRSANALRKAINPQSPDNVRVFSSSEPSLPTNDGALKRHLAAEMAIDVAFILRTFEMPTAWLGPFLAKGYHTATDLSYPSLQQIIACEILSVSNFNQI